ncbi:DUF3883 domain-containing protein [Azohydromonas aeria]|uniref:DUF3883 domain-containing protein n=1 Tax=Azohydromonas aeria TaxID=2590212 RepID=UPI001E5B8363|nr:DUF3883 domain-containing protein [Azohydromonas aeria]
MKRKISDLVSAAAVQAALDEFVRNGRDAFLAQHGFKPARDYFVIDPKTGIEADSKAIVGVAFKYLPPEFKALKPEELSGGDATVVPLLASLGFVVKHMGSATAGEDWTRQEVELIVADYLSMLTLELTGQRYNKTEHRKRLLQQLRGRSNGSVEFKHANISAVMAELGYPPLRGYKPRVNFQRRLLTEVVSEQVMRHPVLDKAALLAVEMPAQLVPAKDFSKVLSVAPKANMATREEEVEYVARPPIKRDYFEREAHNRSLGAAGEEFALSFERWRLVQLGVGQLADKVEHVSRTQGDGLGYDILSFEMDGSERFIEVKTTAFDERTPFFVSANEVRFARSRPEEFRLYRLFDFRKMPRLFELPGPIEAHCALDAATYRASFG